MAIRGRDRSAEKRAEQALRLTAPEEARCSAYSRARRTAILTEWALPVVLLALLTFSGAAALLSGYCHAGDLPEWAARLIFVLAVGVLVRLCLLPVQFWGGHVLDRRFGVSSLSHGAWLWEWLCLSTVSGVGVLLLILPLVEGLTGGLWAALSFALPWVFLYTVGRSWYYEHVQQPIHARFYPVSFLREESFNLPGVGNITLPVYLIKSDRRARRADAFLRLRRGDPAIYVTDTLINEFTDGEERVVMAHEFGHLYDRLHLEERTRHGIAQARRKVMWGGAQLLAGGASVVLLALAGPLLGSPGVEDLTLFPLLVALTLVLAQALTPLLCRELRRDERDADEYALAATGDAASYLSVMRKLRRINLEEPGQPRWSRILMETHPSYQERVSLAFRSSRRHRPRNQRRRGVHWRGWRHIQPHGRR